MLLEVRLFARGCQVHVVTGETGTGVLPELAQLLVGGRTDRDLLGARRRTPAERERARELVGPGRFVEIAPEDLAPSDDEAARQICGELERRGILSGAANFTEGGGHLDEHSYALPAAVGGGTGEAEQPPPARARSSRNLQLETDSFTKETVQILKFHGAYQQNDRDARKTGQPAPVGSMVRVGVAGGILTPEQYLALDRLADEAGDGDPAGHLAARHPVPPRAKTR